MVTKFDKPTNIEKYSNLEKLLKVTVRVMRFVKKLKISHEIPVIVTKEELLEAKYFLIESEKKQFYNEVFVSLKNGDISQ